MFSLIITIISVALVAALALATLYYGGAAFNQGRADAEASKIINQGQQVLAAADLYYANHGTWPTVAKMVEDGYLKSAPQAQAPAVGNAMAADTPWVQVTADLPVYLLEGVQVDTCRAVNKHAYSLNGILPRVLTVYSTQCYGASPDTQDLRTVVSKGSGHLTAAGLADSALLPSADVYPPGTSLPAPDAEGAWTASPGQEVATGGPSAPPDSGEITGLSLAKLNESTWVADKGAGVLLTNTGTETTTVAALGASATITGSPTLLSSMSWSLAPEWPLLLSEAPSRPLTTFCEDVELPPGGSTWCGLDTVDGPNPLPTGWVSVTVAHNGQTQTLSWVHTPPPVSSLPAGTDAAACLSFTTDGALALNTPDTADRSFEMFNGCSRPLVVRAQDEHWGPSMFEVGGYQASVGGEGNRYVPTINLGNLGGAPIVVESGELAFDLYADWYGGPYVSVDQATAGANSGVPMYVSLYTGSSGGFRLTNTVHFTVKFADEPDTAFVPKVLNIVGTLPPSPDYTCDPMTYSCESVTGSGGG